MLLPDTIPCSFGTLAGQAASTAGNGFEIKVLAHTDFHTLVCVLPDWLSFQFAKVLKDKGAGTIVIDLDNPVLFPPGTVSLNGNADLSQGITGWVATGGTLALVLPGPPGGSLPASLFLVPDGSSGASYAAEPGEPFAVVSGQRYTISARVYSPGGYGPVIAGCVFSDSYGTPAVVFAPAVVIGSAGTAINGVPAGVWTTIRATVAAPAGSVLGWPLAGMQSSPSTGNTMYLQAISATYEWLVGTGPAGESVVVPGSATLGDYLLDYEHLWQVWRDGLQLFEFTGQTVTEQVVDDSEQRIATITGPGTANVLSWARAMPPGFPDVVFKTDAIQDGFAEVDAHGNPLLDTGIWNDSSPLDHIALNPPGTCQLTAAPGGTVLAAKTYDITSSSISAQVSVSSLISSGTLDGTQSGRLTVRNVADSDSYARVVIDKTGFYAQVSQGLTGAPGGGFIGHPVVATKYLGSYDANADLYWRISERAGLFSFWTSADGVNWALRWQVAYSWDATNVEVRFFVAYDIDQAVTMSITNLNSDIITPTSAGNIFLLTPIMSVWRQLFDAAQARGTIPWVTTLSGRATDSFGNPWPDAMSVQIQNGTDLYALLQAHAGIVNADWVMQPGFKLQVGLPVHAKGGVSLGRDLSGTVILRESAELTARQRVRARDQVQNLMGAVNSDGTVVTASDAVSVARYQQREGWVQSAATVSAAAMTVVLAAALGGAKNEVLTETISVLPDTPGATPLADFDVGDWVGRERPVSGGFVTEALRVMAIAMAEDATGALTAEVTVVTYRQFVAQQLQYLVDKFGGQFINAAGTVPVTSEGGPGQVPVPVVPGLGSLADVAVGTDPGDPLVFNQVAGVWQNASNTGPSGQPVVLAVGPAGGPKASLAPATGQTLSVDGGAAWTLLSAFQGPSAAASETAPAAVTPLVLNAGAGNEQLGLLFAAGLSGHATYALLLTAAAADNSATGHARIGTLAPGNTTTWAFTTVQTF